MFQGSFKSVSRSLREILRMFQVCLNRVGQDQFFGTRLRPRNKTYQNSLRDREKGVGCSILRNIDSIIGTIIFIFAAYN